MITGINHITLSVKNTEQSFTFYTKVLGFKPIAKWPTGSYLLAGDLWIALHNDWKTRDGKLPEYTHIAFSVAKDDFPKMRDRITNAGVEIWQDNKSEGDSLYFVDPNGHRLEIHASDLAARIQAVKANPWKDVEFFV
jgi:catechol 2,3-dioxygenase-like lactoylglutathione lyase family enzyme